MANRISINEENIAEYIIKRIPDAYLRDVARAHRFPSKESLLLVFEQITLKDSGRTSTEQKAKSNDDRRKSEKGEISAGGFTLVPCKNNRVSAGGSTLVPYANYWASYGVSTLVPFRNYRTNADGSIVVFKMVFCLTNSKLQM